MADLMALQVTARESLSKPGILRTEQAFVTELDAARNQRVWKSVSMLHFGREGETPTHRELHVQKWVLEAGDFVRTEHWYCRDEEVARFNAFLTSEVVGTGDFTVIERQGNVEALLDHLEAGSLDAGLLSAIAGKLADHVEFVSSLDELEGVELLGVAVDLKRRMAVLDRLEAVVLDPTSNEADLQAILDENWWLLGGTYVGKVPRRSLTVLDQFDLPLIRADNVLHIVELKKANVPNLVVPYRNHFAVGKDINEAVNQAMNYLRAVDEKRADILADFKLECRRAQTTVIVGHPTHNARSDVTDLEVREAIRTYNSHLSRIEVLTYEDVLSTARNMVTALQAAVRAESVHVEIEPERQSFRMTSEEGRAVWDAIDDDGPF